MSYDCFVLESILILLDVELISFAIRLERHTVYSHRTGSTLRTRTDCRTSSLTLCKLDKSVREVENWRSLSSRVVGRVQIASS